MNGEHILKWWTPAKGMVVLLVGIGIWVGTMEMRVSRAEEEAKKIEQVQKDVAEIKGQTKIIVDWIKTQQTNAPRQPSQ